MPRPLAAPPRHPQRRFAVASQSHSFSISEDVAYKRVGVARMLRLFPLIDQLLADGRIHLSALLLLKPLLNEHNHTELLNSACGLSKREVEKLVAAQAPRPSVPAQVRKLPEP